MVRFDLTDFEWSVIAPLLLPNKVRGVALANGRRVLNGIFWRLRSGAPWADIPQRYGPHTTFVNRFSRWRKVGVWDRILTAVSKLTTATSRCSIPRRSACISTPPTAKKRNAIPLHGSFARRADD